MPPTVATAGTPTRGAELLTFPAAARILALVDWAQAERAYAYEPVLEGPPGREVRVGGVPLLSLSSYDYLALAADPRVVEAAASALDAFGAGTGGVRLLTGTNLLHHALEERIAATLGAETALVTGSGYLANLATVPHLVGRGDLVLADELAHRSLLDACRLSRAEWHRFPHNDAGALARLLRRAGRRRTLVLAEGVYSMEGDVSRLAELIAEVERHGAFLLVDEAHACGTLGGTGRGTAEHLRIDPARVHLWTGSLSKALGSQGGFVAGSRELITYLRHAAAPYIFSGALAPAAAGAALCSLEILEAEPGRLDTLRANARVLRGGLRRLGFAVPEHPTPIVPLHLGAAERAWRLARRLLARGLLAAPIVFPAVPRHRARLRLCATAGQTRDDIDAALRTLASTLTEAD